MGPSTRCPESPRTFAATWKSLSRTGRRSSPLSCATRSPPAATTASRTGPWHASWIRLRMSLPE